jgi:hypothetical protein
MDDKKSMFIGISIDDRIEQIYVFLQFRIVVLVFFCLLNFVTLGVANQNTKSQEIGSPYFQLSGAPIISFPLGDYRSALATGFGAKASGTFRLGRVPLLYLGGDAYYSYLPVEADTSISVIGMALGPTLKLNLNPRLIAMAHVGVGGYFGYMDQGPMNYWIQYQGGPLLLADTRLEFFLTPSISIGLGGRFTYYIGGASFLELAPAFSFHVPKPGSTWLEIHTIEFDELFPVLYRHYEKEPPGTVVVTNRGRFPVTDLSFELQSDKYLRGVATKKITGSIDPGDNLRVQLPILLSEAILEVTEGAAVDVDCRVHYVLKGKSFTAKQSVRISLQDRNAMRWDDDRKVCLFVTEKDRSVLSYSGSIVAISERQARPVLTHRFHTAMALFSALSATGVSYSVDPHSPYAKVHEDETTVDFVKYPRQTLQDRAGDCDDLSVLFCALLESCGIESAFITVPGHIYTAFKMDLPYTTTIKVLNGDQDLIVIDDQLWIPVETTCLSDGFVAAWNEGIRQWNRYSRTGEAKLIPVREGWGSYPPIGLPENQVTITPPPGNAVIESLEREAGLLVSKYLNPAVRYLETLGNDPKIWNRIGILYARYGLYQSALEHFSRATRQVEYFPSLVNCGYSCLLMKKPADAVGWLERAADLDPNNDVVLLGLSRGYAMLGDFEKSRIYYALLGTVGSMQSTEDGKLGDQDDGSRSTAFIDFGDIPWLE